MDLDPRETFMRDLELPRGADREIVKDGDREYTLRGSETRTLATVGAFRVVPASRLRDHSGAPTDPRSGDLRNFCEQGLVETVQIPGRRDHAVVLTTRGRELLKRHRDGEQNGRQTYYAGLKRARELEHDSQVFDAYLDASERVHEQGASIERVVLDYELKRDYQKWLHENDARRDDYDGHPDRDKEEIRAWALEHGLPYFDDPAARSGFTSAIGFTTRQARFLVTVMLHGGVCVPRQFARFIGTAYGHNVNAFFDKLVATRYAVRCGCVHNRASVYHVRHAALRAIGEPHCGNRKPVPAARVIERLMLLDAVICHPEIEWLATATDKAAYFSAAGVRDTIMASADHCGGDPTLPRSPAHRSDWRPWCGLCLLGNRSNGTRSDGLRAASRRPARRASRLDRATGDAATLWWNGNRCSKRQREPLWSTRKAESSRSFFGSLIGTSRR